MTQQEMDRLVKQYKPLINKITAQFYYKNTVNDKPAIPWEWIEEMAEEGFALAIKNYDKEKSESFMSYAGFSIRNNILNCLTEEIRTVKLPYEEQERRRLNGEPLFNMVSIDHPNQSDEGEEDIMPRKVVMSISQKAKFDDGDVLDYLCSRLNDAFPKRECDMFYMTFGLNGFDETPNQDIAKKFGVSEGLVSQKKKKIISWIRKDKDLCEVLSNLL